MQKVTISISQQSLGKLKLLAVRRGSSINDLIVNQLEMLSGEDEAAYERARQEAMTLLDQSFHLGGVIRACRGQVHER
jgi:hypothetical protein